MAPDFLSANGFTTTGRRHIFRDDVLGLREDTVADPGGHEFRRKVVEYHRAAAVVPLTASGEILLIRHYRHPVGRFLWEIPGGVIDPGESAEEAAGRELLEETGYSAAALELLGSYHPEPAFADHHITLYRGTDITKVPGRAGGESETEITDMRMWAQEDLAQLIHDGQIASSWTLLGLAWAATR